MAVSVFRFGVSVFRCFGVSVFRGLVMPFIKETRDRKGKQTQLKPYERKARRVR